MVKKLEKNWLQDKTEKLPLTRIKGELAFALTKDNNEDGPPSRQLLRPPDVVDFSLPDEDAATVAIAAERVSLLVKFKANTCTVPLSLETRSQSAFLEKAIL